MSPVLEELLSAHNRYRKLLWEYQDAKQAYAIDDSHENWERLQDALLNLKRHSDSMEIKRNENI